MEANKAPEEITLEEKVLAQEFDETIDENLKEFERSLLEEEIIEEGNEAELSLELLEDELLIESNEIATSLYDKENLSSLESISMILKEYPELKITLSL